MSQPTNPCPICCAPVARDRLMCRSHWHLVPTPEQKEVNRTWRLYSQAKGAAQTLARRKDYLKARQAAIDSVCDVTTDTTGETQ
ncbi:MAG: hypothetical protein AB7O64_15320 [Methylibium sp.]